MNLLNGLGIPYSVSLAREVSSSGSGPIPGTSSPLPGQFELPFLGQSQQSLAKYLIPSSRKDGKPSSSAELNVYGSRMFTAADLRQYSNRSTLPWSSVKFKAWTRFLNRRRVK